MGILKTGNLRLSSRADDCFVLYRVNKLGEMEGSFTFNVAELRQLNRLLHTQVEVQQLEQQIATLMAGGP